MQDIKTNLITPWEGNPRKTCNEEKHREMIHSIRSHGILQPLLVRPADPTKYLIIAGERRWRAAEAAGLDTIPCIIREMSDRDALEIALCENLDRADLTPIEEAQALDRLRSLGLDITEMTARLGRTRTHIEDRLSLLTLLDDAATAMLEGTLPVKAAITLSRVCPEHQQTALQQILHPSHQLEPLRSEAAVRHLRTQFIEPFAAAARWDAAIPALRKKHPGKKILTHAESQAALAPGSPYVNADQKPIVPELIHSFEALTDPDGIPTWGELAARYSAETFLAAPPAPDDSPLKLVEYPPIIAADTAQNPIPIFKHPLTAAEKHDRSLQAERRREQQDADEKRHRDQLRALINKLRRAHLGNMPPLYAASIAVPGNLLFQQVYDITEDADLNPWEEKDCEILNTWIVATIAAQKTTGLLWLHFSEEIIANAAAGGDLTPWIQAAALEPADYPDLIKSPGVPPDGDDVSG